VSLDASWTFSPAVLAAVAGYGGLYGWRWRAARAEAGPRGADGAHLIVFCSGLVLVLVALVSPLDRWGEQAAWAHMVQHLMLADLAPILLVLGLTKVILRPATRRLSRVERAAGPLAHPVLGVVAYVGVMWLWHVPALYDAALSNTFVHVLEHLSFAGAGLLYWWHLLSPIRARLRMGGMGPVMYMASTKVLVGFLGVLLAFTPELIYDAYRDQSVLGLTPLEDQNVAGLVMALEQSLVMGVALAFLFVRMLTESDAEELRVERYRR